MSLFLVPPPHLNAGLVASQQLVVVRRAPRFSCARVTMPDGFEFKHWGLQGSRNSAPSQHYVLLLLLPCMRYCVQ
jgi:hypothetical protein